MHRLYIGVGGENLAMEWKVIITNTGEDSITIIDFENDYEIKNISFISLLDKAKDANLCLENQPIGPWDITLDNINKKIFLTNVYNNSISKIDINEMKLESILTVGKFPSTIKIYDGFIFVLNEDSNSISIVDEKSFNLIGNISVGDKPESMEIYSLSKKIFVANSNGHSIDIIDLENNKKRKFKINNNPIRLYLEKEYMYILSHSNESFSEHSNISVVRLDNLNIVKSLDIEGVCNNMLKLREKDILFLTSFQDGHLYKLDLKNNKIAKKFYLEGMPNKIFWDGNKSLLITNTLKNTLTIFNIFNNKVIKNIKVGSEPNGLILIK